MEKRKLTKQDIDKVRDIEGFPIGSDEDIIALSDAPYYTACPNPFIEEFIRENGHPYDEETDDYQREPFSADVSEGKYNPIYRMHPYHTKVPHAAIVKYILHYTNPGDIVFDGFCGTGMTGVAAQQCGIHTGLFQHSDDTRKAIICDLSPEATFISNAYNMVYDIEEVASEAKALIQKCTEKYGWIYETELDEQSAFGKVKAKIDACVWSDVFICPQCGHEFVFWDDVVDIKNGTIPSSFACKKCGVRLKKTDCEHALDIYHDPIIDKTVTEYKQVLVQINYSGARKGNKRPTNKDLETIKKIQEMPISTYIPMAKFNHGEKTEEAINRGIEYAYQFYHKRALIVLSYLWENGSLPIKAIISKLLFRLTKRYALTYQSGTWGAGGGPTPGTLYVPSLVKELNILNQFEDAVRDYTSAYTKYSTGNVLITTQSNTDIRQIPNDTMDYIFTDPPFGSNIMYSELNFLWESWLNIFTNNKQEAISSKFYNKSLLDYQRLMTKCFAEDYRILKPGRWITIEFHNSKNAVWNAIQEAIQTAGFVVADVRILDKKRDSFNQVKEASQAIKQDLVISAYKPRDSFTQDFKLKSGTERTAWAFVKQHLSNLPITIKKGGRLEIIAERQAFMLWDRMVAYHIMQGIAVPMDATDFFKGLDEKYIKRDGMYFLSNQVNKYDAVRATCEVQNIQFSLFVSDEKSAIGWLYQQLDPQAGGEPQTYQDLMPKFMQELKAVDKREKMPELMVILEENFLKDDKGRWYIPDYTKSGDIAKLREKNLLKEFAEYQATKGKLKVFRSEAIRAGFAKLWKEKNYNAIVEMAERLPEETIQEDSNLLMYYDISLSRAQATPTQIGLDLG